MQSVAHIKQPADSFGGAHEIAPDDEGPKFPISSRPRWFSMMKLKALIRELSRVAGTFNVIMVLLRRDRI